MDGLNFFIVFVVIVVVDCQCWWCYMLVWVKFLLILLIFFGWVGLLLYFVMFWICELGYIIGIVGVYLVIWGVVILFGFMNVFLVVGLLVDCCLVCIWIGLFFGIIILVVVYNEEVLILGMLDSIVWQDYFGLMQVLVINDGLCDVIMVWFGIVLYLWFMVIDLKQNVGKVNVLNQGLKQVQYLFIIMLDGDFYFYKGVLWYLVGCFLSDLLNMVVVVGSVLLCNLCINLVIKIQEWDYFYGIVVIKCLQSLFQGMLVVQGVFLLYCIDVLCEVNGWFECVGEDIVLIWVIFKFGYCVGYCEDVIIFINVLIMFGQFICQCQCWLCGLIEVFKMYGSLLFKLCMSMVFVWWNLLFLYMDVVYMLFFIFGIVLVLFGVYWIVGLMILLVLLMVFVVNYLMFYIQLYMFCVQGLKVWCNLFGFFVYVLFYGLVLQLGCVLGYFVEMFNLCKYWGMK